MKALVTAEFPVPALERLERLGYEATTAGWGVTRRALDRNELLRRLHGVEVLICELERLDEVVFAGATDLRLVAACRGEPTNVDLEAATRHGIPVLRTPGRNAGSVADFVIGMMLVEARGIGRGQAHLRRDGWNVGDELPYFHFRGPELGGHTLGIIGFGAVGRQVARRATEGFRMRLLVHDPFVATIEALSELVPLEKLLRESDFVSVHCPPTPETIGMIGGPELGSMKPSAFLINSARASIVQEDALIGALRERTIAGAALDVFWEEPLPRNHPLLELENVTITPHLAGAAEDVPRHHATMVLDDIERWRAGERPLQLANPEVLESTRVTAR